MPKQSKIIEHRLRYLMAVCSCGWQGPTWEFDKHLFSRHIQQAMEDKYAIPKH